MVNNSKVLTVSYGTFSCTLEGFEDSFDTMKAIAEYFRDLAAEDRYFGAEPPSPDADMLARIAQKEISRRVDAREESGSIVLRAADASPAPAPVAPTAVAAPVPAAAPIAQPEQQAVAEHATETVNHVEPAPTPDAAPIEAEAEKAEPAPVEDTPDHVETVEADVVEETAVEQASESVSEPANDADDAILNAVSAAKIEDTIVEDIAEAVEPEDVAEDVVAEAVEAAPKQETEDESIAAKLQRIRAVVSRNAAEAAASEFSEDQHAEDAIVATSDDLTDADEAIADVAEAIQEDADTTFEDAEAPMTPEVATEDDAPVAAEPAAPAPKPTRPVRVVRVKRAAQAAAAALAEPVAAPQPEETNRNDIESSLSDEDEADLLRELAEVEAEFSEDEDDDIQSIFAEDEEDHTAKDLNAAPDVSRLMAETETKMENPEETGRRNSFQHLRAAVQATRAETEAGGGLKREDPLSEAFRKDLDQVVKPTRTVRVAAAPTAPTARPSEPIAPLKLVAEQRIDAPQDTAQYEPAELVKPVRPRRIRVQPAPAPAPAALNDTADMQGDTPKSAESFAEYAEEMGAENLPDLLEAAASYMSHVEGRDQFSRPQLMNKARQIEDVEFSREDGLRHFGQLLRTGKIEKLKGGRFTVSDQIGFKPQNRAAG